MGRGREMKRNCLIAMLICLLCLTGCNRTKIIDQISIVHIIGYDIQNNKMRGTIMYPDYTKSQRPDHLEIRKSQSDTTYMLLSNTNEQTKNPIELSKTVVVLFGEKMAKKGVTSIIDTVFNNPVIGTNVQAAIAEPSAEKFLEDVKKTGSPDITETIMQNTNTLSYPKSNLHILLNNFYGEGRDPFIPIIKLNKEKRVMMDGMAVFKDDRYTVRLNQEETFILGLLDRHVHKGLMEVKLIKGSHHGKIVMRTMRNKARWKVREQGENHEILLSVKVSAKINEHPNWIELYKHKDLDLIKKTFETEINKQIVQLTNQFKEKGVDPLGIGDLVRAHDRNWNERSFYKEEYPTIQIRVKTDFLIKEAGITQ